VVLAEGCCKINSNKRKVDANTLWHCLKQQNFQVQLLAMLVDEGKIKWDDKVIKYLQILKYMIT
jgi:hypothetical protein